jgi:NitT/TauT family transport system substrate-binding protein
MRLPLGLLAVFAALCAPAAAQTKVSVGITNVIADVGHFVAHKRGYFAAEKLDVNFVPFDAAARMIAPMASGDLDVGGGGIAAGLFNAVARGVGLKIVADKSTSPPGLGTGALMVRKDLVDSGKYKVVKDMKGWKLAIPAPGTGTSTSLENLFGGAGFALKDMDVVYLSFPQMVTALENKAVDAAFLTEPGVTTVETRGVAQRIASDDEMFPYHEIAVTLNSEKFIKSNRDAAVRYMRAFLRGTRDYTDAVKGGRLTGPGAEDIIAILTEYSLIKDPAVYRKIRVNFADPDGKLNIGSLEKDLAYFRAQGLIEGKVAVADAIDISIASEAVRDIGQYKRKN